MSTLSEDIKRLAVECGFSACGIVKAESLETDAQYLDAWISAGYSADMEYMKKHRDLRAHPQELELGTCSVIVVLMNYYTDVAQPLDVPQIAKYAWGTDYHYVVKQYLNLLLTRINEITPCKGRAFCDSAPVFERALAARAGLGWIGKSGMLINPTIGSYCFIGELFVDIALDEDAPIASRCGTCEACLRSCPTGALTERCVNASKCLAYQTIEMRAGELSDDISHQGGNRLFGCDECVKACPWNRRATPTLIPEFQPDSSLLEMSVEDWENLTSGEFKRRFRSSPLQRAGLRKLKERLRQIQSRE